MGKSKPRSPKAQVQAQAPTPRPEAEVFADLADLCAQPGYVHVVAHLCFRDNTVLYASKLKADDMQAMFSPSRLNRPEMTTLIGLMVKGPIDWTLQPPAVAQRLIDRSDALMAELHDCLNMEAMELLIAEAKSGGAANPFATGKGLREPIFYCAESAYIFQFLDYAVRKYAPDNGWLAEHRGFTIEQARAVVDAVEQVQSDRMAALRSTMPRSHPDTWTLLPAFCVSVEEVSKKAAMPADLVATTLAAFTLADENRNAGFASISDFNALSATPLIRTPDGEFLSLQNYAIAEALYDTPFYWMVQDKQYSSTLSEHRGAFTEDLVAEKLSSVFGRDRVFRNVDLYVSREKIGEIDVLVVWGDRAIVVQAKSKRLTVAARKGNDLQIHDDFGKAVQAAYDQATRCAGHLGKSGVRAEQAGVYLDLPSGVKHIYALCVVSDHYPALSFQVKQFLRTRVVERLNPPLITDVFTVEVLTEFLRSPLHFLSYIDRRAQYDEQLLAAHELTTLAYHLKKNLWVEPEVGIFALQDDLTADLDVAMAVRRFGIEGEATPPGILTNLQGTIVGRMVDEICARNEPAAIDLGFHLLSLSGPAAADLSRTIATVAAQARGDGKGHDVTWGFGDRGIGITVDVNSYPDRVAEPRLLAYCESRKYANRAASWLGVCLNPADTGIRFAFSLTEPWIQNEDMDRATAGMKMPIPLEPGEATLVARRNAPSKAGRNDPCPCGSGLKFKRCCLS